MIDPKIVWLIEDDEQQADQYGRLLEQASDGELHIKFVPVRRNIADYADLMNDPQTGAIILDQRLSEQGGVNYEGIEVAEFLRTLKPELPVFILTQHGPDDLLQLKAEAAEYVIDKDDIAKRDHTPQVHAIRILRSMGKYEVALNAKQRRLKELIDRKLSFGLNEAETAELTSLRADIERPSESLITQQEANWAKDHQQQEQLLTQLKELTKTLQEFGNQQGE